MGEEELRNGAREADAVLAQQWGVITTAQALESGLTIHQIKARARSGRWERAGRGTYVSGASLDCWQRALMVACLAGPHPTVASHLSAAALLGLMDPPEQPQVTVPRLSSGRLPGVAVHHRDLDDVDRMLVGVIPSVSAARMLADCAEVLAAARLNDLVDTVLFKKLTSAKEVVEALDRWGTVGRKGVTELIQAMEVWAPGPHPGSPAEMRLIRRLMAAGTPRPDRQIDIYDKWGGFIARIDCGWRDRKVGLEYYGKRYHGPRKETGDRARMRRIKEAGWDVKVVYNEDLRGNAMALHRWIAARLVIEGGRCAEVLL